MTSASAPRALGRPTWAALVVDALIDPTASPKLWDESPSQDPASASHEQLHDPHPPMPAPCHYGEFRPGSPSVFVMRAVSFGRELAVAAPGPVPTGRAGTWFSFSPAPEAERQTGPGAAVG